MKFDMDLARQILLCIEADETADGARGLAINIPGKSDRVISYHLARLNEAGLVVALDASDSDGIEWIATHLTYAGHEFIEMYRQDTFWNQAKEEVKKQAIAMTIGSLAAYGTHYIKTMFGAS